MSLVLHCCCGDEVITGALWEGADTEAWLAEHVPHRPLPTFADEVRGLLSVDRHGFPAPAVELTSSGVARVEVRSDGAANLVREALLGAGYEVNHLGWVLFVREAKLA